MEHSQADEDEDYMFLMSFTVHKKLSDIQKFELRIEFLSNVSSRIKICKNFSQLLMVFPQHLTVWGFQVHLLV